MATLCGPDLSGCLAKTGSKCVYYDGPSTTNVGYMPNMSLTEILLLIDSVIGGAASGTFMASTTTTTVTGVGISANPYKIDVKISENAGNTLVDSGGLYVPTPLITAVDNGLHLNGGTVYLGGTLLENTSIDLDSGSLSIYRGGVLLRSSSLASTTYQQISIDPDDILKLESGAGASFSSFRADYQTATVMSSDSTQGIKMLVHSDSIDITYTNGATTTINHIFSDGRMSGADATSSNEFLTLGQYSIGLASFTDSYFDI